MKVDETSVDTNANQKHGVEASEEFTRHQQLDDVLVTNEEASKILATTSNSLKVSRYTGLLYGRSAPPFVKLGTKKIAYRKSTLIRWIDQFPELPNTSAASIDVK